METSSNYLENLSEEIKNFESFLENYIQKRFDKFSEEEEGFLQLKKSIKYTLLSPCKRFRPALSFSTCQALSIDYQKSFPLALAVEMIHTASLIHDDLPCMDNDKQRRGKSSNHIVFKEDIALLAGNSLLIEAFYALSHFKQNSKLIQIVSEASSFSHMMGGQAIDLRSDKLKASSLNTLYHKKTGALIQACIEGVFYIETLQNEHYKKNLKKYAYSLGQAFQFADDLQDQKIKPQAKNHLTKEENTKNLNEWTQKSLEALNDLPAPLLKKAALFNQERAFNKL